jgi:Gamma-glutamyl cyclotransferase, AIG2-like
MFLARFFPAYSVTVFHLPDVTVRFDDLLEHQLLFVWDELMDPVVVFEQLGRYVPFAPAVLADHARVNLKEGEEREYRLLEQEGALAPGYVLLGLAEADLEVLDGFEQVPIHRVRHTCRVRLGDVERVAVVYSGAGSYLGEDD